MLVDKACTAAGDINHLAYEIGIDALAEVIQVKVNIINAVAELGGKVVAQVGGL